MLYEYGKCTRDLFYFIFFKKARKYWEKKYEHAYTKIPSDNSVHAIFLKSVDVQKQLEMVSWKQPWGGSP